MGVFIIDFHLLIGISSALYFHGNRGGSNEGKNQRYHSFNYWIDNIFRLVPD